MRCRKEALPEQSNSVLALHHDVDSRIPTFLEACAKCSVEQHGSGRVLAVVLPALILFPAVGQFLAIDEDPDSVRIHVGERKIDVAWGRNWRIEGGVRKHGCLGTRKERWGISIAVRAQRQERLTSIAASSDAAILTDAARSGVAPRIRALRCAAIAI